MNIQIKPYFRQISWQVPVLVLVALAVALGTNHWRSDGIALVGDWSADARYADTSGDSLVIPLDQAKQVYENKEALFVDARPVTIYSEGHIRGAINIPWQDVDNYLDQFLDQLQQAPKIITYCDGESCELSHELALFFKEIGFENVQVLVNGWTVWKNAGLPTEGDHTSNG